MKKVLVIGSGGAGKSTFARRLGSLLDIEVLHLDMLYWRPGWVETPKPVWRDLVAELTKREQWIMDGNYSGTFDVRVAACDTVIFLDMPRRVCLWRIIRRRATYRNRNRPDMTEGCPEQISLEFILWVWHYGRRSRPKVLGLFDEYAQRKRMIRLRSPAEVERFLADVAQERGAETAA
ncbi:MAG TPA: DNA topology modulation protein [Pyrinomonadaceae bacterium]|nr:DNA topology modulation protein [Pyrinomonadaceae bacterium]